MITLFGCVHFFNFVSFLVYPTEFKRLKCAMLGGLHCKQKMYIFLKKRMKEIFAIVLEFMLTFNKMKNTSLCMCTKFEI